MPSANTIVTKEQGWVIPTVESVEGWTHISNIGIYDFEYLTNPTQPPEIMDGHTLEPKQGVNTDNLPDEQLWIRARFYDAKLALSK